jgi:hypothetical protein
MAWTGDGTEVGMMPGTGSGEWLSTGEAAALWNHVLGCTPQTILKPLSEQTVRRMCRDGTLDRLNIEMVPMPGRYYIRRQALLEYPRERCCAACERAEATGGPSVTNGDKVGR